MPHQVGTWVKFDIGIYLTITCQSMFHVVVFADTFIVY